MHSATSQSRTSNSSVHYYSFKPLTCSIFVTTMDAATTKPSYESSSGVTLGVKQRTTPIRILARRYQLTYGDYKYLEIGINVRIPIPAVEIAIGDKRGNEVILNYEDWQFCMQQRFVLSTILADQHRNFYELASMMSSITNNKITLKVAKFGDRIVLRMQSCDACVTMACPTVRYMFALAPCVAHMTVIK